MTRNAKEEARVATQEGAAIQANHWLYGGQFGRLLRKDGYLLVSLKVRFSPTDIFIIINAVNADDIPEVFFVGGRDTVTVTRKLKKAIAGAGIRWRIDQWSLEKLDEKDEEE